MFHKWIGNDNGVDCYRCGTVVDYPWLPADEVEVEFSKKQRDEMHDDIHMLVPSCAGVSDNRGHHYIAIGAAVNDVRIISAIECAYGDAYIGQETDLAYVPRYCKGDS